MENENPVRPNYKHFQRTYRDGRGVEGDYVRYRDAVEPYIDALIAQRDEIVARCREVANLAVNHTKRDSEHRGWVYTGLAKKAQETLAFLDEVGKEK